MEKILSLFELSKNQITADINNRTIKAHRYLLSLPKTSEQPNKQQSPHVQLMQQFFGPSNSTFSHPVIFKMKLSPFTAIIRNKETSFNNKFIGRTICIFKIMELQCQLEVHNVVL